MVHQYGNVFAVLIVKEKFGSINAKVAESLLKSGSLTLDQVTSGTGIELENVKESLINLTQHNIVQPYVEPGKDWAYVINFSNIHRLPRFLEVVDKELPESCVRIFSSIAKDGRCTLEQLAKEASQDKSLPLDAPAVSAALSTLVNARFVERCPPVPLAKNFAPEPPVVDKAKLAEYLRFCFPAADTDDKESVLWRLNYEEFMRRFRREALIKNAKIKMGKDATSVLETILLKTQRPDEEVKLAHTAPMNLDDIAAAREKPGDTLFVSRIWVRDRLRTLGCKRRKDRIYSVDLNAIIEWARNRKVMKTIEEKHGFDTMRVFRRLITEDKTVHTSSKLANCLSMEQDDVEESLRTLLEEQYVVVQQSPSRFIDAKWKVNCKHMIWEAELQRRYHVALTTKLRLACKTGNSNKAAELKDLLRTSLTSQDKKLMLFHEF